jgi:hypothetical protein
MVPLVKEGQRSRRWEKESVVIIILLLSGRNEREGVVGK